MPDYEYRISHPITGDRLLSVAIDERAPVEFQTRIKEAARSTGTLALEAMGLAGGLLLGEEIRHQPAPIHEDPVHLGIKPRL